MADVGSLSAGHVPPQALRVIAVVLVGIGILDAIALFGGGVGGSPVIATSHYSARPTEASASDLAAQYTPADRQVRAGQRRLDQESLGLTSDIVGQEQRIQNDSITYSANEFGLDCAASVSVANVEAYGTCVDEEEQTATDAETDIAAANTRLADDRQQLTALITSLSGAVGNLVQQLARLPWPTTKLRGDAEALSAALTAERTDLEQELSAFEGANDWSGEHFSVQVTADGSVVGQAADVLDAALGISPQSSAT